MPGLRSVPSTDHVIVYGLVRLGTLCAALTADGRPTTCHGRPRRHVSRMRTISRDPTMPGCCSGQRRNDSEPYRDTARLA